MNFGSFCGSSLIAGLFGSAPPDVIYALLPPLPLGVTAGILASFKRARLVVNIQDIFPRAAVEYGMLTNPRAIRFFEKMEMWIYRRADRIAVISEGMREDLLIRSVPAEKVVVIENWADPSFITPGPRNNEFRRYLDVGDRFLVIYSGGINNNANLEPVIEAADILRDEPFAFAIVGEGQFKPQIEEMARSKHLDHVRFLPFQPVEQYPNVLRAADLSLVSLNARSAATSVPSKIYKQMAAGRPILAITPETNELYRLVTTSQCGKCVLPDDAKGVAEVVRWAARHGDELHRMGENARRHLEQYHSLDRSVDRICELLQEACTARKK
jgi:colanic acid biosynthesis glycosyl transferase WcaI